MSLKGLFVYLNTVGKHRRAVRKLCFKCGLYWQGLTHDLSKYSWTELSCGAKYSTGKYSPHVGQRKEWGYSAAWLHHKGRNKHHIEYWVDVDGSDASVAIQMPPKYFVEMICDRVAACKVYMGKTYTNDAPLNYYMSRNVVPNKETHRDIIHFLSLLAEENEEVLVEELKRWKRRKEGR